MIAQEWNNVKQGMIKAWCLGVYANHSNTYILDISFYNVKLPPGKRIAAYYCFALSILTFLELQNFILVS